MSISEIEITNIKGIEHKKFQLHLLPNKPNLLVATNGFGKSSIATAFASMNTQRLTLEEKDCYKEDTTLQPKLSITICGQQLSADKSKNDIRTQYDVTVIRSGLLAKGTKGYKGSVRSNLEINPILLFSSIPDKIEFNYKFSTSKSAFGLNGKILPNISDLLLNSSLIDAISIDELAELSKPRIQTLLNDVVDAINQKSGSGEELIQWITENVLNRLRAIQPLYEFSKRLVHLGLAKAETDGFWVAYQIAKIFDTDKTAFKSAIKWRIYSKLKQNYAALLLEFRSSKWQWAELKEDKKKKTLTVEFPKAHQLSNGQRDLVTLVIQMHKALYGNPTKPLILVIDEVFDYLDDANLVAFQYYVTSIIQAYKDRNQQVYPLILTHLDPGVFFDFCFNKYKIQINYLQATPTDRSKNTIKLIQARDNQENIKERLEKSWFHFHTDDDEIHGTDWPENITTDWRKSQIFHEHARVELTSYLAGRNYDPLLVCFAVRVQIEKLIYHLLPLERDKANFLETNTTRKKIEYVAARGVDISETYFMLGLIYNTNLHWKPNRDYVSPLVAKLNHTTIRNLIERIANPK